jgi:hypothetical protein
VCTLVTLRMVHCQCAWGLAIVIHASCVFIEAGRVEQTGLWAMLTPPASPNARIGSHLAARKNSKNYLVIFYGVVGMMTRRRAQGFSLVSSLREKPLLLS